MSELLWPYAMAVDYLRARLDLRGERGEITEKTILVSFFALLTLAICGVIGAKLLATVNDINTKPALPTGP